MELDDGAARPELVPLLPPRPPAPSSDVWTGVELEPDLLHHHLDHAEPKSAAKLLPTTAARLLVTIGWAGIAVATVLLLVALMPAFETGDSRNFVISFDEAAWYGGTLVASSLLVYAGWTWWSISAAANAHRIIPLATSPWLPTAVYLGVPLIVLAGLEMDGVNSDDAVLLGSLVVAVGHLAVVASFRGSAERFGGGTAEFSKVFWLPLAWFSYRLTVFTALTFVDDESTSPLLLLGLGGVGVLFPVGLAMATWQATDAFDGVCRRLGGRTTVTDLPNASVVAAALRSRAAQG